jgi:hypothetical protein
MNRVPAAPEAVGRRGEETGAREATAAAGIMVVIVAAAFVAGRHDGGCPAFRLPALGGFGLA